MEHGKRQTETHAPRQKRRPKRGGAGRQVGFVLLTILLVGICTAGIFAAIFMKYVHTNVTPVVQVKAEDYDMSLSSFIYYQDRKTSEWVEYQTIHGEVNRIPVDIEDMPDALWQAAVAVEDERFFQHDGVDWLRTGKAVMNMFLGMKDTFGGSTITQQMLKNLTLDNQPYVNRKVREIFRALEFEKNYTKAEILELYLNNIYLGKGCYGVQTAAQFYFGKDASELTAAECASLIAITNNPSLYGPMYDITYTREDGTTVTPREKNKVRQGLILDKMAEVKGPATLEDIDDPDSWSTYLTKEEAAAAKEEPLNFLDGGTTAEDILKEKNGPTKLNNWFVDQVFRDVTADLAEELHISLDEAEKRVYNGGYKIYTTMDLEIQELAESVYADRGNLNNLTSRDGQPIQSGITVMDPYTGNIVAIVGQMGAKEGNLLWSYAADKHQVGSSMKPLTAYAPAIDSGAVTPGTTFDDYPVEAMNGTYWPKNSPNRYRGFTSVAAGIQHSINTIAVQTLMAGGVAEAYAFATEKLCLDLEPEDMDRSPLGLGGLHRGLSTIEMAAAFSCFANGGIYNQPRTYTQVLDKDGNVLLENSGESHVAMKETTAYLMTKMLKSAVDAGTGSRAKFSGMSIAGKTGTTNDNYDRYFVGYTPYYVAAVWTGYKSNARISYSGNPAITMWKKVMEPIHQELANKSFSKPSSGLTTVSLCADSGLLATDACAADVRGSRVVSVEIASGTAPTEKCNLHVTRDYCTEGKCLATANCPAGSVTQKAFLNHERVDYGSGVVAEDNAYLLSVAEAAVGAVPPAEGNEGESALPTGGCPVHTTAPPEITDPDAPVDPNLPVDPSVPQDPSDPNNLPPPDQGGGDSGAGDASGGTEDDEWWSIIGG
nr:transglycosylase domain-containing protein [uncultured Dysosmobacter sp.]